MGDTKYFKGQNGAIRRETPKARESKKERIKRRWEGRETERFEGQKSTGRGNVRIDQVEAAKAYLRTHEEGVTQKEVADYVGCEPARAGRLLDLLSGVSDDKLEEEFGKHDSKKFLVYSDEDKKPTLYYISKDTDMGINII